MFKFLFVVLFWLGSSVSHAAVGRTIQLQGILVTSNKTQAILKDDKGIMKVPVASVDIEKMKVGQWVIVSVDLLDFYRLNPDKFKNLQSKE